MISRLRFCLCTFWLQVMCALATQNILRSDRLCWPKRQLMPRSASKSLQCGRLVGDPENSANFDVVSLGFPTLWYGFWTLWHSSSRNNLELYFEISMEAESTQFSTTTSSLFRFEKPSPQHHPSITPPAGKMAGSANFHDILRLLGKRSRPWSWPILDGSKGRTYPEIWPFQCIFGTYGKMMITWILWHPKAGGVPRNVDDLWWFGTFDTLCCILQGLVKHLEPRRIGIIWHNGEHVLTHEPGA